MADTSATTQLFEAWRKQFEEGTQAWARLVSQTPAAAAEPMAFWRPVLDQGLQNWARLLAQTPATLDMLTQWKQFLEQWIEAWSRVLGQAMGSEGFAQQMGRSLDQWLVAQAPVRKAAEQSLEGALQALNLASRSQVTSVARQIVELEERLERLEDAVGAVLARVDHVARLLAEREAAPTRDRRDQARG